MLSFLFTVTNGYYSEKPQLSTRDRKVVLEETSDDSSLSDDDSSVRMTTAEEESECVDDDEENITRSINEKLIICDEEGDTETECNNHKDEDVKLLSPLLDVVTTDGEE